MTGNGIDGQNNNNIIDETQDILAGIYSSRCTGFLPYVKFSVFFSSSPPPPPPPPLAGLGLY